MKRHWEKLKDDMLVKIKELNDITPWVPTEPPEWWFDMMDPLQKLLLKGSAGAIRHKKPGTE